MSITQAFSKSNLILNDTILEKRTFASRWQNIISYSGDLYLTSNKIIFNSDKINNLIDSKQNCEIEINQIISIKRKMRLLIFPDMIEIVTTKGEKIYFCFYKRKAFIDKVNSLMNKN